VSVEVNPVGLRCGARNGGLSCAYCHEAAQRAAEGETALPVVDHEAVQRAVKSLAGRDGFSLHGGEPLLASYDDLERLWAFGLTRYDRNGVQTSGRPITERHIQMFQRYRVHVGFSIDGPRDLNDARRAGTLGETRAATSHSVAMLGRCLHARIGCSLIVTLHRLNATAERLPRLLDWFRELDAAGLHGAYSVRLHLLEVDGSGGRALALSSEENLAALLALRELERTELRSMGFDVFADIEKKLRDPGASASCVWNWCDPWVTTAVVGIRPDGRRSMCGRVAKGGQAWLPAAGVSRVRQAALWATSQEDGGCRECRWFLACGGHCPGTALGGDWRKRTADCAIWRGLFERMEIDVRVRQVEEWMRRGPDSPAPGGHGDEHGDEHGDHTDGHVEPHAGIARHSNGPGHPASMRLRFDGHSEGTVHHGTSSGLIAGEEDLRW